MATAMMQSNDAAEKLFCVSFLSGVYTTAIALGELVGPPVLCPASSVSGADILAMFENYARNNPQHLDTRPEVTALLAFRNAVGCPKRPGAIFSGSGGARGDHRQTMPLPTLAGA